MAYFGLSLAEEKCRLIEFGRFAENNRRHRGEGKPETFSFSDLHTSVAIRATDGLKCGGKPAVRNSLRSVRTSSGGSVRCAP